MNWEWWIASCEVVWVDKKIGFVLEGFVFGEVFWHDFQGGPIEVDKIECEMRYSKCEMKCFVFTSCEF